MTDQLRRSCWLDEAMLLPGRTYSLRIGTQAVAATVTALKHKVEMRPAGSPQPYAGA